MLTASQIMLGFGVLLLGIIIGVICSVISFIGVVVKMACENKECADADDRYDFEGYRDWD